MKRRLLAIAMTLAMALSLLPVTALADGPEDQTPPSVTETDGSDQTNESLDEGTQTDTETPVEDPEQGTEPTTPDEEDKKDPEQGTESTTPTVPLIPASVAEESGDVSQTPAGTKEDPFTTIEQYSEAIKNDQWDGQDVYLVIDGGAEGKVFNEGEFKIPNEQKNPNPPKLYLTIRNCTFNGNTSGDSVGNDSFMYLSNCQKLVIEDCIFNASDELIYGINWNLIQIEDAEVEIRGCTFTGTYEKNAIKLNQRNGSDDAADDVKEGLGDSVTAASIKSAVIEDCTFQGEGAIVALGSQGKGDKVTSGSGSPYYKASPSTGDFPVTITASDSSPVIVKLDYLARSNDTPIEFQVEAGMTVEKDEETGAFIVTRGEGAASVGGVEYATLRDAVLAVPNGGKVTMLKNTSGAGIGTFKSATDGLRVRDFTIDFGGYTYTCTGPAVGSTGTQSQAFHLEWTGDASNNAEVTLKNGTITSESGSGVSMLVQNYCDLTLDGMTLDGGNLLRGDYAMSNNCGNVTIKDTTITVQGDAVALDACDYASYTGVTVTVEGDSKITGKIEHVNDNGNENNAHLVLKGGTFTTDKVSTDYSVATAGLSGYCVVGYELKDNGNGTWTVTPKEDGQLAVEAKTENGTVSATLNGIYAGASTTVERPADGAGSETAEAAGTNLKVDLTTTDGSADGTVQLTVNADTAQSLVTANAQSLAVASNVGTVTLDREALSQMEDVQDEVVISLTKTDNASKWEVTVTAGGQEIFDDAPGGRITISVPAPSGVTGNENFKVYCVDNGMEDMNATYVAGEGEGASGTWTWTTTHLSTFMGIEVDDDDQAVWVIGSGDSATTGHGTFEQAIEALSSAHTPVIITLIKNVTIDGKNDSNTSLISIPANKTVTIQNAEGDHYSITANFNYININNNADSPNTGKSTGVVNLGSGSSLTISNVPLNLNGNANSQQGNTSGIHMGTGFVMEAGSSLTLNEGTEAKLNTLSRGFIHYGSGDDLTDVIIDGATLKVTDVSGNGSNGGAWKVKGNSDVTFENVGNHGLSVESLTVDGSSVKVKNAGYVGIYADEITLEGQADVEVTNCANNEGVETASNGIYEDKGAVQLKNDSSTLTVKNSTLTLSGNGNSAKENEQTIYVGKGDVTTENADITGAVTVANDADKFVVSYVNNGTQYDVKIVENNRNITLPGAPAAPGSNYSFVGWSDGITTHKANAPVSITKDTTFTAVWNYTGGGSGGSSVTRYTVSVPSDIEGGTIKVSPTRASRGQTVTITVTPDEGWELDELAVYDSDGDRIDLERKSDTRYTFEMPRGKVEIEVSFAETEPQPEPVDYLIDVDEDDWCYDAVAYVLDAGIMSGVSETEFAPNATLTRAMIAQMLWALEDKPVVNYLMTYDDVAAGAWYGEAVRWISSQGFMSGYSDEAFGPNDPLTREQLCLILYNYADWAGYGVSGGVSLGSYLDAGDASAWAVEALEWALDAGLISGRGEDLLAPAGTATRAEIAQIMMNFLEKVAE